MKRFMEYSYLKSEDFHIALELLEQSEEIEVYKDGTFRIIKGESNENRKQNPDNRGEERRETKENHGNH